MAEQGFKILKVGGDESEHPVASSLLKAVGSWQLAESGKISDVQA